jgi:hypothetical protein
MRPRDVRDADDLGTCGREMVPEIAWGRPLSGSDEQMFGAEEQVPQEGKATKKRETGNQGLRALLAVPNGSGTDSAECWLDELNLPRSRGDQRAGESLEPKNENRPPVFARRALHRTRPADPRN